EPSSHGPTVMNAHQMIRGDGFVLVGVVMLVLALTILGLSLFALSSYEAQFFNQSLFEQQAYQSALGGQQRALYALTVQGEQLENAHTALSENIQWAYATQWRAHGTDSTSTG